MAIRFTPYNRSTPVGQVGVNAAVHNDMRAEALRQQQTVGNIGLGMTTAQGLYGEDPYLMDMWDAISKKDKSKLADAGVEKADLKAVEEAVGDTQMSDVVDPTVMSENASQAQVQAPGQPQAQPQVVDPNAAAVPTDQLAAVDPNAIPPSAMSTALRGAGLGLGAYGVYNNLQDDDYLGAALGAGAMTGNPFLMGASALYGLYG